MLLYALRFCKVVIIIHLRLKKLQAPCKKMQVHSISSKDGQMWPLGHHKWPQNKLSGPLHVYYNYNEVALGIMKL